MREINMSPIRTIEKAVDVLKSFTIDSPSLTIDEIAERTGIPKNTVYRILYTLETKGFIKFDQKKLTYQPGLKLIEFGFLQSSVLDIKQEARELLISLHEKTKQTVLMAVREDDDLFYLFKKENLEGLKVSTIVGLRRPIMFGVLGPAIMAYLSDEEVDRILKIPILQRTPNTVTDIEVIKQRLKKIKEEGVNLQSNETTIGVTGIAAPIFDISRAPVAAIGVVGPSFQLEQEQENVKQLVKKTSEQISLKMGYSTKS